MEFVVQVDALQVEEVMQLDVVVAQVDEPPPGKAYTRPLEDVSGSK